MGLTVPRPRFSLMELSSPLGSRFSPDLTRPGPLRHPTVRGTQLPSIRKTLFRVLVANVS